MRRGTLHTTTVRFDVDTWSVIVSEAQRLGVARSEYIRAAVLLHIGQQPVASRFSALEERQTQIETLFARLVRSLLRESRKVPR